MGRVSLRWKLLVIFTGAFTVVFAFLAVWIFQYATATATARLETQLEDAAVGGATTISGEDLAALVSTVPPVPDPGNPTGLGYPDSPLYASIAEDLYTIYVVVTDANPYTYFKDAGDGRMYFAASGGFMLDPKIGVPYKVPVSEIVDEQTYDLMEQGLTRTVHQDPYTDNYGSWISTYTPVRDSGGTVVGAIGVDFPLTYIADVQKGVQQQLLPLLAVSYVVLLALVLTLSASLTGPLSRLTGVVGRIADGERDIDVEAAVRARFPREMHALAQALNRMMAAVGAREESLNREIGRLTAETDGSARGAVFEEDTPRP